MMSTSGVTIQLFDQTSAEAQRIAEGFENMAKSADKVNQAMDPAVVDKYFDKLNQAQQQQSMQNQRGGGGSGGGGGGVDQTGRGLPGAVKGVSGAYQQAARGDVAGGVISGAESMLKDVLMKAGPVGMAILGGLAVAGAGNEASKLYEARMGPSMQLAGSMGSFTDDIRGNTREIRKAMKDVVSSVAQFGKTFEEGTAAAKEYISAGGKVAGYTKDLSTSAQYSTAYGLDMGRLSGFQGGMGRFGQTGVLDVVNSVMKAQGLGPGQYDELLSGMEQIFQSSLGQGIIKSAGGIATAQEYFGRMGEQYRGKYGTGLLTQMDQAAMGATGLGRQEDIFMYRAAAGMSGGDFIQTMKLMEGGFTGPQGSEMFQSYMGQMKDFTGGDRESMIKQIKNTMGVSYTQAEDLYNLYVSGASPKKGLSQGLGSNKVGVSTESQFTGDMEYMKQLLIGTVSATAFDIKAGMVHGSAEGFRAAERNIGIDAQTVEIRTTEQVRINSGANPETWNTMGMNFEQSTLSASDEQKEKEILQRMNAIRNTPGGEAILGTAYSEYERMLNENREANRAGTRRGPAGDFSGGQLDQLLGILNIIATNTGSDVTLVNETIVPQGTGTKSAGGDPSMRYRGH